MARVTVEDCVVKVPNRFELVLLAAQRAREITSGAPLSIDRDDDKNPVVALREIADETGDLGPEHAVDVIERGDGILDGVVQETGHYRGGIELHLSQDARNLDRMGEIWIAGSPQLRAMGLHRIHIGTIERALVGVRIVRFDKLDELELPHHDGIFPVLVQPGLVQPQPLVRPSRWSGAIFMLSAVRPARRMVRG